MDILLEPQHIVRTGSVDGVLRSYDFRKGFLTNDRMGAPIASMACTKNGEPCLAVSCLEDSTVRLMDVASGELVNTYSGNHVASQYKIDVDVLADDSCVGK
jgi:WD40 repeat protein